MLEQALIWYARRFPIARGKLRIIDAAWQLAVGTHPQRIATLVYGGFKAPCDLRDMLQRQFYFFGTYFIERDLLASWSRLAGNAQVVFDLGANAGIYSLAALAANPYAVVHAFEPTPEIAERLRATAALNDLGGLHVHEAAVSDVAGLATLVRYRGTGNTNDGMNFIQMDGTLGEQVITQTLDGFCAAAEIGYINLMKMDIQGAEASALRGASGLLKAGKIGTLFLELNWTSSLACPATESIELLQAAGYCFAEPSLQPYWRAAGPWLHLLSDVIATRTTSAEQSGGYAL